MYNYQPPLVAKTYQNLLDLGKVVLAATPGAGKTHMAMDIIDQYLIDHPSARVLIFAHAQLLLRTQWYERLQKYSNQRAFSIWKRGVDPEDLEGQIIIAIPQTLLCVENFPQFDLAVIDEAHQYYLAGLTHDASYGMVQKYLQETGVKHQLLLTGSPARLIKAGFKCNGITLSELLEGDHLTDVDTELAELKSPLTFADYDKTMEVSSGHLFSNAEVENTLEALLPPMELWARKHMGETDFNWKSVAAAMQKIMVVCRNIEEANAVYNYFLSKEVGTVITTSEHEDSCSDTIDTFKLDPDINILIVVRRGILGFDFPDLMCLIDLSASLNVDKIFQLLCRLVRKSPNNPGKQKLFFKLTSDALAAASYHVMSYVVAMSLPEYYYDPTDYQTNPIPVKKAFVDLLNESIQNTIRKPPSMQDLPALHSLTDVIRNGEDIQVFAKTTFKEVRRRLYGLTYFFTDETAREEAKKYATYSSFRKTPAWNYFQHRGKLQSLADIFPEILSNFENRRPKNVVIDELIAAMQSCNNRYELKTRHLTMYKLLLKDYRDLLDEYLPKSVWTVDKAYKLALEAKAAGCKSRSAFREMYPNAEDFLRRSGNANVLDTLWEVTPEMRETAQRLAKAKKACMGVNLEV